MGQAGFFLEGPLLHRHELTGGDAGAVDDAGAGGYNDAAPKYGVGDFTTIPQFAIIGDDRSAQPDVLTDADASVEKHLNRIKSSVDGATAIIESLLNLTRMKEPMREQVDISLVIDDAIATANVPDRVTVIRDYTATEEFVNGDREQLRMAFKNIVKNATEAMVGGGDLTLQVRMLDDEQAEVLILDTGSGIAKDQLEKVLQPLFTTKAKGIGFGLSIANMIVERHGGNLENSSQMGVGTAIAIRLPRYRDNYGGHEE